MDPLHDHPAPRRRRRASPLVAATVIGGVALTGGALAPVAAPEPQPAQSAPEPTGTQASCPGDPIMAGYYRTWRDVSATQPSYPDNAAVMSDLPADVDIAFVFNAEGAERTDYFQTLREEYAPALQAQGTQVVRTIFVDVLLELPVQSTDAGYQELADDLIAEYVTDDGLDGLDVDVEMTLTPGQVEHVGSIFDALATRLGPTSGTDDLLIYDTNRDGDEPLLQRVAPLLSYVLVQSYGRSASGLQDTWETYEPWISSCRYLVGFSFYEEWSSYTWGDTVAPFQTSTAADYARWSPEDGESAGIFSYAIDRDWKAEGDDTIAAPTYEWTRWLVELQESS